MTATKTRKKQQTELIKRALQAQDDKKREERENFLITTIPITVQAAYEPRPVGEDHDEGTNSAMSVKSLQKSLNINQFLIV